MSSYAPVASNSLTEDVAKLLYSNQAKTFLDRYLITSIGEAGFNGEIFIGHSKSDFKPLAFKVVKKKQWMKRGVWKNEILPQEIAVLYHLKNVPGVIDIVDYFETKWYYIVVMESFIEAEDMYEVIDRQNGFDDYTAKFLFRSILTTVRQMQEEKIHHLDIKPENILIATHIVIDQEIPFTKIIDLGSAQFMRFEPYIEFCGTYIK